MGEQSVLLLLASHFRNLAEETSRVPSNFSEFFLLEAIILLMDFLLFIACHCSFLFQQELKKFNITSSCLILSSSIMLLNYCSYQQRNCEIKIAWLSCTQCFPKTVCSIISTIFCTSAWEILLLQMTVTY